MQFAHNDLSKVEGLSFYRLMGSGKGKGFNPLPDWSTYSLLQVWETEKEANEFFNDSALLKKYHRCDRRDQVRLPVRNALEEEGKEIRS